MPPRSRSWRHSSTASTPSGSSPRSREYNAAVDEGRPFDPARKDGRRTRGLAVEKTNWANRIDRAPFRAYAVTCGITFTYGGLAIDPRARVLDEAGEPIPGLYAAGELVGGLFWDNYPGGAGLMAGVGVRPARRHRRRRRVVASGLRALIHSAPLSKSGRSIASHDGRGACRAGRIG